MATMYNNTRNFLRIRYGILTCAQRAFLQVQQSGLQQQDIGVRQQCLLRGGLKEIWGEFRDWSHRKILILKQQYDYNYNSNFQQFKFGFTSRIIGVHVFFINSQKLFDVNYRNQQKLDQLFQIMEKKFRPTSSKPISVINMEAYEPEPVASFQRKNTQANLHVHKTKLSQIVPELPSFCRKSSSTALLYSKFIVKGLKQDKISLVRNTFHKKKQEITEAETIDRVKSNKTLKSNLKTQQKFANSHIQDQQNYSVQGQQTIQLNSLLRAQSAKVFRKSKSIFKQSIIDQWTDGEKNKPEKTQKEGKKRPTTAKAGENSNDNSMGPSAGQLKKTRPTTATGKGKQNIVRKEELTKHQNFILTTEQLSNFVENKIKENKDKGLLRVDENIKTNHIQKNKRNTSQHSKKSTSIYLTNLQSVIQRQRNKQRQKKNTEQNDYCELDELQPKKQMIFQQEDKQKYQLKSNQMERYLSELSPLKFSVISKQIKQQNKAKKMKLQVSQVNELLSKDLDSFHREQGTRFQMDDLTAKVCYEDLIKKCDFLQFHIAGKTKLEEKLPNSTLNVCECQRIIEIYRTYISSQDQQQKKAYLQQIREITKNLKYFHQKPQQEINKFFTLPFDIVIADEGCIIIEVNSPVSYIHIILNGSVVVESSQYSQSIQLNEKLLEQKIFNNKFTLYDGEVFGEPVKSSQRYYKERVSALEQSLLIRVKYQDYVGKFFSGSQVQQKLSLLSLAFRIQILNRVIKQQDLQILSLSLEKYRYPSKSLIFRQGDKFDKIIFVGKGKLSCINQFILKQEKEKISDMKEIDRYIRNTGSCGEQKQNEEDEIHLLKLEDIRRDNLFNYRILRQDKNLIYYYFYKQQKQLVVGDIVNWEVIADSRGQCEVNYSLMSILDDTQVYFLSKSSFQYLPYHIKKVLGKKAGEICRQPLKVQSMKQIREWNKYKQKLCKSIIKQKQQRKSKFI